MPILITEHYAQINMEKKLPVNIRFALNSFLIALPVNIAVATAHMQNGKDLSFLQILQVLFFALWTSAVFLAPIFIILALVEPLLSRPSAPRRLPGWSAALPCCSSPS